MGSKQRNHDGGIDENERVRNDDKRRALDFSAFEMLATLLSTGEVVANFEEDAGDDRQECSRVRETI
jgi:hypothetical protein